MSENRTEPGDDSSDALLRGGRIDDQRELGAFLAECRAALADEAWSDPELERRIARAVLARTTREDLRWRGDWRLVRGFVTARLRSSVVLRVAAASLVAHVVALPVLAWYGLRQREPATRITFETTERAVDPFPERAPEPEPALEAPRVPQDAAVLREGPPEDAAVARVNSARWARVQLRAGGPEPVGLALDAADTALVEALLEARARRPLGAPARLDALDPAALGSLERALWAELLLDRFVLAGAAPLRLAEVLAAGPALADPALLAGPAGAGARLEVAARARAEAYGLLGPARRAELRALRSALAPARASAAHGESAEREALARLVERGESFRAAGPYDPAWLATLDAALAPAEREGRAARRWLAFE